jgi:hypothetical protein
MQNISPLRDFGLSPCGINTEERSEIVYRSTRQEILTEKMKRSVERMEVKERERGELPSPSCIISCHICEKRS